MHHADLFILNDDDDDDDADDGNYEELEQFDPTDDHVYTTLQPSNHPGCRPFLSVIDVYIRNDI